MKKMLFGAGALLLSGSAIAAVVPGESSAWTQAPTVMGESSYGSTGRTLLQKAIMPAETKLASDFDRNMAAMNAGLSSDRSLARNNAQDHKAVEALYADLAGAQTMAKDSAALTEAPAFDLAGAQLVDKGQIDMTGMGGPEEVATSYPPCDPGPGDDRCIQLYERGVRASYAQWQQDRTGMGGPLEDVDGKPAEYSMAPDKSLVDMTALDDGGSLIDPVAASKVSLDTASLWGEPGTPTEWRINDPIQTVSIDSGLGEDGMTRDYATAERIRANTAFATDQQAETYTGMGGPEESEGYPPCRSRSDDRCIQVGG